MKIQNQNLIQKTYSAFNTEDSQQCIPMFNGQKHLKASILPGTMKSENIGQGSVIAFVL